jgi:diacylglycerol kinase family enzyme
VTIRRNRDWGISVTLGHRPRALSDVEVVRLQGSEAPMTRGGNLHRSLGSPSAVEPGEEGTELSIDAISCRIITAHGVEILRACAEVTVGHWYGRSGFVVITNCGTWKALDVAPSAHPNDGRAEMLTIAPSMSLRERWKARRRAVTGTHLPHPSIELSTVKSVHLSRRGRQRLFVDSVEVGEWSELWVEVQPDAFTVVS